MNYFKVLEELKNKKVNKVIVTGAQRAGTRFTTNVIGNDLGLKVIDELDYGINQLEKMKKTVDGLDNYVVQAPALSHFIEEFPKDATIIYMYRPLQEILASQKRINWQEKTHEPDYINRYKKIYPNAKINWNGRLAEVKNEVWEKVQRNKIENLWYNVDYSSLNKHPMWKPKDKRKDFKANQIK